MWQDIETTARLGRNRIVMGLVPWAGLTLVAMVLALNPPEGWDRAVLSFGVVLLCVLLLLMIRDTGRRYQAWYGSRVLPKAFGYDMPLSCDPKGGISLVVLGPSRLFPLVEAVDTKSYMRGHIGPFPVEVSALRATRQKILRRGRKVQEALFSGAVYVADLGAPIVPDDLIVLGPRASRSRAQRKAMRDLHRITFAAGFRAWGTLRDRAILNPEVRAALKELLGLVPNASIAITGGRTVVIAVPRGEKVFTASSVFLIPSRDPRLARSLEIMRAVAHLVSVLGANPDRIYTRAGLAVVGNAH